jgi:hypothetical protein
MKWSKHVAGVQDMRNEYINMVGYPEKRPLGRPMRRCEDNIRIGLKEAAFKDVDWIQLAHYRIL